MAKEIQHNDSQVIGNQQTHHAEFFQSVNQAFECATKSQEDLVDHFYNIAGHTVRLRFAGPALVHQITPAFAHLSIPPTQSSALTICLWDSASTCVSVPDPPWSWKAYTTRMEMRGLCDGDGRIQISYHPDSRSLSLLDVDLNIGIFWIQDSDQVPYYESGAPLRLILNWWLSKQGKQFAHAAAVGQESGGVLLVGKGGSGKSTSSLTCLNSNLTFVSDDYCVFRNSPVPYAYSVYSTAKLERHMLPQLPYLAPSIYESNDAQQEKAMFFLWEHFSQNMIKGFPIRALLVPRITDSPESTLHPIAPTEAIRALAPNTIVQLPGTDRTTWMEVIALARQVPCYDLVLGSNLTKIPGIISGLLAKLNSTSGSMFGPGKYR